MIASPASKKLLCTRALLLTATLTLMSAAAQSWGASEAEDVRRGQDVTIIAGEERTIYEYRQNGVLHRIKVVPRIGRPYYLVPDDETRAYGDLEQAKRLVPRWVLIEF